MPPYFYSNERYFNYSYVELTLMHQERCTLPDVSTPSKEQEPLI